jgi:hypothetical protein
VAYELSMQEAMTSEWHPSVTEYCLQTHLHGLGTTQAPRNGQEPARLMMGGKYYTCFSNHHARHGLATGGR